MNSQQQRAAKYVALPLLIESHDPQLFVEPFEGIELYRGGDVKVENQIYGRHQAISLPEHRLYRRAGSDLLRYRSNKQPAEEYLLFYRYRLFRGFVWVNLVRRSRS